MSQNLLNLVHLKEQDILELIELANNFKSEDLIEYRHENLFPDKKVASIFCEPSTRTKLSFEIAACNLGAKFIDFNIENSSIQKGETLETELIKIPMVDLPLGATEDRVCGTIDIEKALTDGVKAFEPGLLAKANRGLLYVDEVNLLDDHLVDILLDSAASGWNTVEREGISIRHPARFVLVGSGNPEEGELRPQLLDRFGMHAEIRTVKDPLLRVKVVEERTSFDQTPQLWLENYAEQQQALRDRIVAAQKLLPTVELEYDLRIKISQVCSQLDVDGLRGDIVTNRAAKAYAS